jgi:hypothetical protein
LYVQTAILQGLIKNICVGFTLRDNPDGCRWGLEKMENSWLNLFIRPLKQEFL